MDIIFEKQLMKKSFLYLMIGILLASLSACKNQEDAQHSELHFDQAKEASMKDLFSKAEVVPLENFLSGANDLKKSDVEHHGNNQENVLETKNYIISIVKKGNDLHNWHSCFYNKSSHDIWKIASYIGKKKNLPVIKFADRNHLYCAVDKATLSSLLDSMKEQGVNIECNTPLQDDMFLIEYTLK